MDLRALKPWLITLWIAVTGVSVFVASVFLSETPQFWTALAVAAICLVAMRRSRIRVGRMFWWNCAAILTLWALFDLGAFLWMGHTAPIIPRAALAMRLAAVVPGSFNVADPLLGTRLAPNAHERDGDVVYDTDADGLRIGPPLPPGLEPRACVLFFGCSYTFGDGVSNDQTFPYLVQQTSGGRFQSRNFGVRASAPHYALGQVESGMVERAAHCTPTHAIYMLLPHHLARVAGKFPARFGPRYALRPDHHLARTGSLNRTTGEFVWDMLRYTSALYVTEYGYYTAPVDDGDVDLTVALLEALHARLLERYPEIRFDVLYWNDDDSQTTAHLGEQLPAVGVPVHQLAALMREIQENGSRAYLEGDHHPSPWAHATLAEYIRTDILGGEP